MIPGVSDHDSVEFAVLSNKSINTHFIVVLANIYHSYVLFGLMTTRLNKRYYMCDRLSHRRRSRWNYGGGRTASAEGGSVPSGVEYGEGCPLPSRLGGLESVVSSPSGIRGTAPV